MKKLFTFFLVILFAGLNQYSNAQLVGNLSIPGNYPTIAAAITDLNSQGVGTGGVIFSVAAGHTEIASNLLISIVANHPSASNPVVFQKSGGGANPLITAAPGDTLDGIIKLLGTDYITFDAIDVFDPVSNTGNQAMEWGYVLLRNKPDDACQNVVIRNCNITLQKSNTASIGIYMINRNDTGGIVIATDPAGLHKFNRFYGNNISNVYRGIIAIASSTNRDSSNQIGVTGETANSITNWGGSNAGCEGVRCEGQADVKVNNNIINGGTGTAGSNGVYGILVTLGGTYPNVSNYEISNNNVTVSSGVTSAATYGIRALSSGDTVRIHHNTVENSNVNQNSTAFHALIHDQVGTTNFVEINDNIVRNNSLTGTGAMNLLGVNLTSKVFKNLIHHNQVYGNQKTGASGTISCMIASDTNSECYSNTVYNNSIPFSSGTTSSIIYGYINTGDMLSEKVYDNNIYNLWIGGSNTATGSIVAGIRSNVNATANKEIYNNSIRNLRGISGSTTTAGVVGIWTTLSATAKIHSNKIDSLTNTGASGTTVGIWATSGQGIEIYNNFISNLTAPNSSNANGVIGINSTSTTANSTIGVYYNTIYIAPSGGSTFGSSGISATTSATATTATLTLKNNIVINLGTSGSTSGVTAAYRRSSTTLTNFDASSDYNNYYTNAGTRIALFYDGTNSDVTIGAYQTRVSPRESNSVSVPVTFVDVFTGNLHLSGASVGNITLVGTPIPGITTDIDGDPRNAVFPYKGADESSPIVTSTLNLSAKLEAYSPNPDTIRVSVRNISAPFAIVEEVPAILDASGNATVLFSKVANGTNYYIVVRHRNSIETWSKSGGEVFTGGVLNYDFTSAASQAFGNNQVLVTGDYSFYTGDIDQNGVVNLADITSVYNASTIFSTGYVVQDVDGNMVVNLTDQVFVYNNAVSFIVVKKPI